MKEESKEKKLKGFSLNETLSSMIETLSSMDIIWKVLGLIISVIIFIIFGGKLDVSYSITDSEAVKLIKDYEQAYYNALEILEEEDYYTKGEFDYDKEIRNYVGQEVSNPEIRNYYNKIKLGLEADEPKALKNIKKKVKKQFKNIVSDKEYENIENEIFFKDSYKEIETVRYSFFYVRSENKKNNYEIKDKEIILYDPMIVKNKRYADGTEINEKYLKDEEKNTRVIKTKRKLIFRKLYIDSCELLNK